MYDYEEVLIVNSLPANFFASQSLCWKNLIQLKVRTIVHFLPFRALTTRGVKENDTNARTGYHRDNIAIYLMCRLRLVMGVALASEHLLGHGITFFLGSHWLYCVLVSYASRKRGSVKTGTSALAPVVYLYTGQLKRPYASRRSIAVPAGSWTTVKAIFCSRPV